MRSLLTFDFVSFVRVLEGYSTAQMSPSRNVGDLGPNCPQLEEWRAMKSDRVFVALQAC